MIFCCCSNETLTIPRSPETGWEHSCMVSVDNVAYCWGDNRNGQRGTSGLRLGMGNSAGEMAIVVNNPIDLGRGNTPMEIVAAADGTIYVLDHAPLQRFLRASPGVYLRLLHHRTGDAGTG